MMIEIIVDALVTGWSTLCVIHCWRQGDREVMRRLRKQGLTIEQIGTAFKTRQATVQKRLAEESTIVEGFVEDQALDWKNRHEAWCRANNKHIEDNPFNCTCEGCQAKEQTIAALRRKDMDYCTGPGPGCLCSKCRFQYSSDYYRSESFSCGASWDNYDDPIGPLG